MRQVLDLLLGSIEFSDPIFKHSATSHSSFNAMDVDSDFAHRHPFEKTLASFTLESFISSIRPLLYVSDTAVHSIWTQVFSAAWSSLTRGNQKDVTKFLLTLLSKDFHSTKHSPSPYTLSPIQVLLSGIAACDPKPKFPPHVIGFLARTFGGWFEGIEMLRELAEDYEAEDEVIRGEAYDALAKMFESLEEVSYLSIIFLTIVISCEEFRPIIPLEFGGGGLEAKKNQYILC
jgi:transformation/transcription domain-associated protein